MTALRGAGYRIIRRGDVVKAGGYAPVNKISRVIRLGQAGTVARFLPALLLLQPRRVTLILKERMASRPMKSMIDIINNNICDIQILKKDKKIFIFRMNPMPPYQGGTVKVPGNISSQFISSLMMIAPLMKKGLRIIIKGNIVSQGYILLTAEMMKRFGIRSFISGRVVYVPPQKIRPSALSFSGDWSAAAYYVGMAMLGKADITLKSLPLNSSHPDRRIFTFARRNGVRISRTGKGIRLLADHVNQNPFRADLSASPDLAPTLAVVGGCMQGTSLLSGLQHLKFKESNRIKTVMWEMKRAGMIIRYDKGKWEITGCNLVPGHVINPHNDHRIAMSFAMLIARFPGILIRNEEVVKKSYPSFWQDIRKLGVRIEKKA